MASTGVINGTMLAMYIGSAKITVQKSCSISFSQDARTWINKDSGGFEEAGSGKRSWEASGEADFKIDATYGYKEMFGAYVSGTSVTVVLSTSVAGDSAISGTGVITKLDVSAGTEENGSVSYSWKGSGAPVLFTITA